MNGRRRLAQDARQFRRVNERHPAEGVKHILIGEGHVCSLIGLWRELDLNVTTLLKFVSGASRKWF